MAIVTTTYQIARLYRIPKLSYTSTPPYAFMSTLPFPYYQRLEEDPVKGVTVSVSLLV